MRRSALIALCLLPVAAFAAPQDELAKTRAAIKVSEQKKQSLVKQEQAAQAELKTLQEKLVRAAADYEKSVSALAEAQKKLAETEAALARKEEEAALARKRLDGLSQIAIRLSRTPPQAMVLMPADGKSRIQAAQALAMVTSEIKRLAQQIAEQMEALQELSERQQEERERAEKFNSQQSAQKKELEAALKKRRVLRDQLTSSRKKEEEALGQLARKAQSLSDLVTSLQEKARAKPVSGAGRELTSDEGVSGTKGVLRNFASAKGRVRAPVSGRVVAGFGAPTAAGESSKGITIAARSAATVVAPFDAEVAYSGTFLNYGRLVILKHRGGNGDKYHTLLSGLARVDVKAGDFLLEGEPIGAMGSRNNLELYVELREDNQPINPGPWIRGL